MNKSHKNKKNSESRTVCKSKRLKILILGIMLVLIVCSILYSYINNKMSSSSLSNEIDINNIGFEWVDIPQGSFNMGSSSDEGASDEHPQHQVFISEGFKMLKYEVTQYQWEIVMGTVPWRDQAFVKEGWDYPAVYVSWYDVQEFISRLNNLDNDYTYRLPTEAEWEYSCRADTNTRYYYGNNESNLSQYAWWNGNSDIIGKDYAHRVGQKIPNTWGLYDMHGNVWEWCQDWYDERYYDISPDHDPLGPDLGDVKVIRGGSWHYDYDSSRSAKRNYYGPEFSFLVGFRLIRISA